MAHAQKPDCLSAKRTSPFKSARASVQPTTGSRGVCISGSNDGYDMIYDMIYLLTAIGLSPGDSSTVHIYTQTIHRTIQNKQYIEQHNNFGRVRAVPRLG